MTLINFETFFLIFIIYSFGGWLIETIGDFIKTKRFINRGFLLGPYCPIYGTGVILISLLLSKYENDLIALFFLSFILCGALEYFTSFIMEKAFKARWWDYSNMKFNINGRICLETLVLFGLAGIITIHYSNPFIISLIQIIPELYLHIISAILLIIFLIDCITSLNIINSVKTITISVSSQVKDNTNEISSKVREIIMQKSAPYKRLISAFPQAFADKLKESKEKIEKTTEKVKDNIQDVKDKTLDNIQNIKEKTLDNIQNTKNKTLDNIQNVKNIISDNLQTIKERKEISTSSNIQTSEKDPKKFFKKYRTKIKLSLMKFNNKD